MKSGQRFRGLKLKNELQNPLLQLLSKLTGPSWCFDVLILFLKTQSANRNLKREKEVRNEESRLESNFARFLGNSPEEEGLRGEKEGGRETRGGALVYILRVWS